MNKDQIEISFESSTNLCPSGRRSRRMTKARWWFSQMRHVVDRACDWKSSPPPRPEQTYLTLARGR